MTLNWQDLRNEHLAARILTMFTKETTSACKGKPQGTMVHLQSK